MKTRKLPRIIETTDELHTLPSETFGTVYADPPWQYGNQGTRASTSNHYRTMTVAEIAALEVGRLAKRDAHLHLWTTSGFLPDALEVIKAWGFEYRSSFVWVKPQMGMGNYWRLSHEFVLTAIRGDAKRFAVRNKRSWVEERRTVHSRKPESVRAAIREVSPGPYLELFGRKPAAGWCVVGDEVVKHA